MSVEQTTQLIQLILNSALMLAIAVGWWGVLWLRHSGLISQIQGHQRRTQRLAADGALDSESWLRRRQQRYHLQTRYRLIRHSVLIMHYVLLGLVGSLFCLSLRTLFGGEWLIPAALALFILGIVGLLLSVLLTLMDFYHLNLLEDPRVEGLRQPLVSPGEHALPHAGAAVPPPAASARIASRIAS